MAMVRATYVATLHGITQAGVVRSLYAFALCTAVHRCRKGSGVAERRLRLDVCVITGPQTLAQRVARLPHVAGTGRE